jgi:hypothetical protein
MDGYYIPLVDAKKKSPPASQMWARATDNSWALHREHIRAGRCIVLFGPDPAGVYPPAKWDELEVALDGELEYVRKNLARYPAYCVLNLCRLVYSYQTKDVVVSKTAAGHWAEKVYPSWQEIIVSARKSYAGKATQSDEQFMANQVKELYEFATELIQESRVGSSS